MASLPTAGELKARVVIKLQADSPNSAFSLDQSFSEPVFRWARIRSAGLMAHHASMQTGEAVTHFIDMRRDAMTLPELMATDKVIEHKGRRYRVLRAIDMEGAGLFTSVECKDIGPINPP